MKVYKKSSISFYLFFLARVLIGTIILIAGISKIIIFNEFVIEVTHIFKISNLSGLLFNDFIVPILCVVFILFESVLSIMLIWGVKIHITIPLTGLLLFFFLIVNLIRITNGETDSCKCFGSIVETTYIDALIIDLILLFIILFLMKTINNKENV